MPVQRSVQIVNEAGIHARPAAEIVKTAARFKSDITIVKDGLDVNAKSIMGVMMLAAECGSTVLLSAAFVAATRGWTGSRRVLNISSGLGRRAMASSAAYCAVKAGMDHFSRAVALEEAAVAATPIPVVTRTDSGNVVASAA